MKKTVFTQYDLSPASQIQFEITELSRLFAESGSHPYKAHIHSFYQIIWFKKGTGERGNGLPLCIHNAANRTFVRFRQMLEHHYRSMHTVKEYANHLNVSTKTLTNCVYESSRSTPLALINERIVLEAKRQLLHSSLKVKEIAFQLGFEDPSYFVKFFKRHTGCLPADFREQ